MGSALGRPSGHRRGRGRGAAGPDTTPVQSALMTAIDELDTQYFITDATWAALREHLSAKQLLELVPLVGNYRIYSVLMNNRITVGG
jgi:hypothetical protein